MSALESLVWMILGYTAMPIIFIAGLVATALVTCYLLEATGHGGNKDE